MRPCSSHVNANGRRKMSSGTAEWCALWYISDSSSTPSCPIGSNRNPIKLCLEFLGFHVTYFKGEEDIKTLVRKHMMHSGISFVWVPSISRLLAIIGIIIIIITTIERINLATIFWKESLVSVLCNSGKTVLVCVQVSKVITSWCFFFLLTSRKKRKEEREAVKRERLISKWLFVTMKCKM